MIEVRKVNKTYITGEEKLHVLKDVSFEVHEGEFVGIMGESGSGKSTLMNIIGFMDNKYEGEYLFDGKLTKNENDDKLSHIRNRAVGFVFQNFNLIDNYTVRENVELPLLYAGLTPRKTKKIVLEALESVGIPEKIDKYPTQLSGGQKQRVAIARAIVHNPKFILADEPTGALDSATSREIMEIFKKLNIENKTTVVMVTHDRSLASYCSKVLFMVDGNLEERFDL
ncbi:ABC transporter ATP-binding protein [Miniphocaeibacter halophilus]|uniref:ABC transporter ATP-binding protein n=1 Tax=Miniphocaeibacter halophilus TaxID=2931922 RepID=A0AC61MP99_9FIRM|nr:ABC transporter ATP-binding protein [Miniphocaeibacter halophilus]QQK07347.1 ABC transporter ATP-binding protein [Miniphocaeibacter halophilus]